MCGVRFCRLLGVVIVVFPDQTHLLFIPIWRHVPLGEAENNVDKIQVADSISRKVCVFADNINTIFTISKLWYSQYWQIFAL